MPDNELSFRERICNHFVDRFLAQAAGVDGARIGWDAVTRKPLTKDQQHSGFALGIYDTSEKVKSNIGHDMRFLNIVFEFHVRVHDAAAQDIPSLLNSTLAEVQRVAGLDIQCGEPDPNNPGGPSYKLAINTEEKGSEIDIGGSNPSVVAGVAIFEVTYRTKSNNPFRR